MTKPKYATPPDSTDQNHGDAPRWMYWCMPDLGGPNGPSTLNWSKYTGFRVEHGYVPGDEPGSVRGVAQDITDEQAQSLISSVAGMARMLAAEEEV